MAGMQRYFKLRPSRLLAALLSLVSVLSLVSLWLLPLPMPVMSALTAAILYGVGSCLLRDAGLRRTHSCVAFRLEDREQIVLVLRNGMHLPGRISPDSLVTPYLVLLNVALSEQRGERSLRIMPDAMGPDSIRRLRVALEWGDRSAQAAT